MPDDRIGILITSCQIRMACAALRWSSARLATEAGVGVATVSRIVAGHGVPRSCKVETLDRIRNALEVEGITFLGVNGETPGGGPGVRCSHPPAGAG